MRLFMHLFMHLGSDLYTYNTPLRSEKYVFLFDFERF